MASTAPRAAFLFDKGVPTPNAYLFASTSAAAAIEAAAEGTKRKFSGVAYSGDVIEGHWYWDRVVFDLSTTKAPQKLPMLLGHENDQIVGFSEKVTVGADIGVSGILSSFTDEGKEVAALSDEGFPWQMSVRIEPASVEEVRAGQEVTVNGRTFTGPINVFRNNVIREISFTPTGWDSQTSAVAMSRDFSKGVTTMTEAEIKALQEQAAKAAQFEATANTEKVAREKAEAEAKANADKVKEFEAKEAQSKKDARTAAIKKLFEDTGVKHSDATAKPYLDMDEDSFAAISEQMRGAAKKAAPGSHLFEEQARSGAGGGVVDAAALSEKARELMFAAEKQGRTLGVVDAVAQAKKLLATA